MRAGTDGENFPPTTEYPGIVLGLRGGGDPAEGRKSARLADDARVPAAMWYFAGGRGPPPTGKQLRDRKAKQEAYVQRKREEGEAKKAAREAARELKKAGVKIEDGGNGRKGAAFGGWRTFLGKRTKAKTRGDEETKDKEGGEPKDGNAAALGG